MKRKLLRLNIGDGCPEGFTDIQAPIGRFPYKSSSVSEFRCAYYLSQIAGKDRGRFMDEVWRVLVPDAKALFITPYWSSFRALMDYRYEWPPVCEQSYLYFNKQWRESQKVVWCKCNFDILAHGYAPDPDTAGRHTDVQADRIKHYLNAALDLHVTLVKRK